jgi:hypothetical protein
MTERIFSEHWNLQLLSFGNYTCLYTGEKNINFKFPLLGICIKIVKIQYSVKMRAFEISVRRQEISYRVVLNSVHVALLVV